METHGNFAPLARVQEFGGTHEGVLGQAFSTASSTETLCKELQSVAVDLDAARRAQIDSALTELLSACRACAASAARTQEKLASEFLHIGAHHLRVSIPQGQVDVLFVAPLGVQLTAMPAQLSAELERRGEVRNLTPGGTDGKLNAPGLQLELRGVRIRVLLAQRFPNLPQNAVIQNSPFAGLLAHEATEKILSEVPNRGQFSALLRFIRHWAHRRGVYGGFMGFPGGVAWAICCARVCQFLPDADLAQLVSRFFRVYSRWDWRQPVALDGAPSVPLVPPAMAQEDELRKSSMSVLLPVAVEINTTEQVSETTLKIMQKELRRGYKMVQQVELRKAQWPDVWKEAYFFQRHRHYLEFDFMASTEPIFHSWIAWAMEQIQTLVKFFEVMSSHIVTLRPWPEWVDFQDAEWPHARAIFMGLHLERQDDSRRSFDLREPIVKFLEAISAWPDAERHANKFELLIKHVRLGELEQWLDNKRKGLPAVGGPVGEAQGGLRHYGAAMHPMGPPAMAMSGGASAPLQGGFQSCSL